MGSNIFIGGDARSTGDPKTAANAILDGFLISQNIINMTTNIILRIPANVRQYHAQDYTIRALEKFGDLVFRYEDVAARKLSIERCFAKFM